MKLEIDNIKRGDKTTLDLDFVLQPYSVEFYGGNIDIISPVHISGRLYIIEYKLYINLKIETDIKANCDRCLETFTYTFSSSIDAEIIDESLFEEENDDAFEDIIYYEDNVLDLEKLIKEHIAMNIPIKFVCDENCQGLCAKCGTNLKDNPCSCNDVQSYDDIDPRLAKLKMLLQQENNH